MICGCVVNALPWAVPTDARVIATFAAGPAVIVGVLEDEGEEEEDGEEEDDGAGEVAGATDSDDGAGEVAGATGPTGVAVVRTISELCESGEAPIAFMARIAIL